MINLERVATFLAVATHGGFREAAKHTGLSQPAVSQHVKRLEASLNVNLVVRNNAGSTLTPEGRAFLPYAESLVRAGERACALFEKDRLLIGASSNVGIYLLQPYLKRFTAGWDGRLDVTIGSNPQIADKLANFEVDLAVMEWWDDRPGFAASLWRSEELVLIVPPDHPWAAMESVPAAWLKDQRLLGGESGTGTGRLLQHYFGDIARTIGVSLQLGSTEAVKRAVGAGLGISLVMASSVADEARSGRLRALPLEGSAPKKDLFVICRDRAHPDAAARSFKDFLLAQPVLPATASAAGPQAA